MMNNKNLVALVYLLCFSSLAAAPMDIAPAASVGMSPERLANVKSRLQQVIDEQQTGGIQVLIARRGKVVMHENLGYASVEDGTPITDDTLFRIYSMTKPIVGTAMLMLYEDGYYSLSDPVAKHIPEFANLKVYGGADENGDMILENPKRPPTIHDLMMHTAGFTYGIFSDTPVDAMYREKQIPHYDDTLQQMIEKIASTPLSFHPGERFEYSVAVDIQGYLIEKWTGQELGAYLKKRLFGPLGMDQTMPWVSGDKSKLLANVYSHDESGALVRNESPFATNHFHAPGGFSGGAQLISTADDYWRFAQMLLNDGEFNGTRFLAPGTIEMMRADRLRKPIFPVYPGAGFGLNVAVYSETDFAPYPVSRGEYFWSGIASTLFWIDPEEELVVVMMTQYLPFASPVYRDLMHRLVHAAIVD
jgi:CubicO group peptidase (beta-lactamase class C family)